MSIVDEDKKSSINIYYEKTSMYRSIHADGLIGGITPKNIVNLNFYSTRNSIPKSVNHSINYNGELDEFGVNSPDSKVGIFREIEMGIYMNKETAEEIYDFLKIILKK